MAARMNDRVARRLQQLNRQFSNPGRRQTPRLSTVGAHHEAPDDLVGLSEVRSAPANKNPVHPLVAAARTTAAMHKR